jgi:metallo-beta-lactamase family protein
MGYTSICLCIYQQATSNFLTFTSMKITFCGAAQNVTGSRHLLEIGGKRVLLDCGMFQGGDEAQDTQKYNEEFLFDPKSLDAVIISHAHIDHMGALPRLVKLGYKGPVYVTTITAKLAEVMLRDAAHIQEQDADFALRHFKEKREPTFTDVDVTATMKLMKAHDYHDVFEVLPGVKVSFYDAGHVFGSAQTLLQIQEADKRYRLVYTGDYGRKGMPILNDPEQIPEADMLITESTYASHLHDTFAYVFDELEQIINDVIKRGGKIIIPGFSLERTQELVYVLHKLYNDKKIPAIPIFVDSPLSTKISKVFIDCAKYYDNESFREFISKGESPFAFKQLTYITSSEESKKLNFYTKSCIIIASSGMCQAGRIVHHLKHTVSDPRNVILIVGFMAKGTLGRRIVEKKRKLLIHGEYYDLKADVVALNEFSAHGDKLELLENIKNIKGLRQIFVVHGEETETAVMRDNIYGILKFKGRVDAPTMGEEFTIEGTQVSSSLAETQDRYFAHLREKRDVARY